MATTNNTISMGAFKKANEQLNQNIATNTNNNDNTISLAPSKTESSGAFAVANATSMINDVTDLFRPGTGGISSSGGSSNFFVNGSDKMQQLIKSSGLQRPTTEEWYNKFSRFQIINPWRRLAYTKEYLFFTKPDLIIYHMHDDDMFVLNEISDQTPLNNLFIQSQSALHRENTFPVPFFREMDLHYRYVLEQLQYSCNKNLPFMNLLSNAKRSNLEVQDINASADVDSPVNIFGTKISYRGTSYSSDDGYDFTIDFEDSKYLEIYRFLKAYDIYENRKHMGLISIPREYVDNKILHDQFSIYKFIVDEDFSTLVYWAKMTGCYIKSVPRASFSDLAETGGLTYTVQFRCSFIEDMTPEILSDFNRVSDLIGGGTDSPLYDKSIDSSSPDWVDRPYIEYDDIYSEFIQPSATNPNDNTNKRPKLVWKIKSKTQSQSVF